MSQIETYEQLKSEMRTDVLRWIKEYVDGVALNGISVRLPNSDNIAYINVTQTFSETQAFVSTTTDASGTSLAAAYATLIANPSADNSGIGIGLWATAYTAPGNANDQSALWGGAGYAVHYGSGVVGNMAGLVGVSHNYSSTTVSLAYGVSAGVSNFGSGDIGSALAVFVSAPVNSGGGGIDYANGITIQNQGLAGMTDAKGIHIDAQSGATNNYAIYSAGGRVSLIYSSTSTSGTVVALYEENTVTPASSSSANIYAAQMFTLLAGSQNFTGETYGGAFVVRHDGSGTASDSTGLFGVVNVNNGSGTITSGKAIKARVVMVNGTITSAYGLDVLPVSYTAGTLTSIAQVAIEAPGQGTNRTNLLIGTATIPSGTYNIYSASTEASYFAGRLILAEISSPSNPPANQLALYAKDDGGGTTKLYIKDSAGTETELGAGGSGGGGEGLVCEGRLTLTSGTPVTTSDVTGATNVYFTPHIGNRIALYDGASWEVITFSETTEALGTLTSGLGYDIFAYNNGGTLDLEKVAWTNDTTRATALTRQDGVLVKSGDATRRYLGSFYTTSTTQTEDSRSKRYLWNYYNRVPREVWARDTTNSWSTTSTSWEAQNGNTTDGTGRISILVGWAEDSVTITLNGKMSCPDGNRTGGVGIGVDSTSTNSAQVYGGWLTSSNRWPTEARYVGVVAVGRHYIQALQISDGTTLTLYGDNGVTREQYGLIGIIQA